MWRVSRLLRDDVVLLLLSLSGPVLGFHDGSSEEEWASGDLGPGRSGTGGPNDQQPSPFRTTCRENGERKRSGLSYVCRRRQEARGIGRWCACLSAGCVLL